MKNNFPDFLQKFEQNGLRGRYWRAPAFQKSDNQHLIVFIYGHHASLERNQGALEYLRTFGQVLAFDIPGFGGMDSFYKIGQKPTLENYAQFIDQYLKTHCETGEKFTLIGMSVGFLFVTRFLQIYPAWRKRIRVFVSLVGFVDHRSLKFKSLRHRFYVISSTLVATSWGGLIFRYCCLNALFLRIFYGRLAYSRAKFKDLSPAHKRKIMKREIDLWHMNDVRTWAFTSKVLLTVRLANDQSMETPLLHVAILNDQFFDNDLNVQYLRGIYSNLKIITQDLPNHAPTVVADMEEARAVFPDQLIQILDKEKAKT